MLNQLTKEKLFEIFCAMYIPISLLLQFVCLSRSVCFPFSHRSKQEKIKFCFERRNIKVLNIVRVEKASKMSLLETDNVYLFIPNIIGEFGRFSREIT